MGRVGLRHNRQESMSEIHVLAVPFTGLGIPGFRGNGWLRHRIAVFNSFVLPSLAAQTRQDFTVWCQWRPQERKNPVVADFIASLDRIRGFRFVHTFHGVTLWDDKFPDATAELKLKFALANSLPELKGTVGDAEWVYLTCQPSDDMYRRTAFERLREVRPNARTAVAFTQGYVIDCGTLAVREYDPDTLPPFSTVIFPAKTFLDPQAHYRYVGPYKSHEHVGDALRVRRLPGRMFMVGTHGGNISTVFNHPYANVGVTGRDREVVAHQFGIWNADPVVRKKGARLWGRVIVNMLPKPMHDLARLTYNRLRAKYYGHFH